MAPTFPLQRTKRAHRLPTALWILHRPSSVQLQPNRSPLLWERRSARREGMQARTRRLRSPPKIVHDSNSKERRRKLPNPGAMADLEEKFLNGHKHPSLHWMSQRNLGRAKSKVRVDRTPLRYLRKEFLPTSAIQNFIMHLLVSEEARRARTSPLPGNQRGPTSPWPGRRRRE